MEIEQADHVYRKIRSIQGWFWPQAGRLIAILNACQKRQGVSGNIFEIGVWHGKSAILLASMLANQESLGACDTFDDIAADGGSMKLKRFRQNMNRFFDDASFVRIYSKSSRDLSREEMTVNCRLIHIDGAHDSYNVYEDIVLADSCLHEKGAIVMDDAYQPAWPGVTDGIYRFLHHRSGRLVPLVSGFKKLVLVRPNAVVMYSDSLADSIVLKERFAGVGPFSYNLQTIVDHPTHCYFERAAVQAAFCPGLTTAAFKRFPWLRNPVTRWLNQKLRWLRGQ